MTGKRCDINDAAVAALKHGSAKNLASAESSGQVGLDDRMPFFLRNIDGRCSFSAAGTVDQYVDLTELGKHARSDLLEAWRI